SDAMTSTTLLAPTGQDETDPAYVYKVSYRDGTTQTIQPYLAEDNFVASIKGRGLVVSTNRNSGVVTVSGRRFRPSYFVDTHSPATLAYWNTKKDANGVAYQPVDVNADGVIDYRVLSVAGFQIAYGLDGL
ncbi:MAG: hypothetical protein ACTS5G_04280, partial [Burkholderiales bacterium]